MTKPFCMQCTAELFGPAAMERMEREVAEAPRFTAEQVAALRVLFQSARPRPRTDEVPVKECGH